MRKTTIWVSDQVDTNRPVQSQNIARSLKFLMKKRDCTVHVAKTKALISFADTAKLIYAFVFAYADCWFSHAAAQMYSNRQCSRRFLPIGIDRTLCRGISFFNFDACIIDTLALISAINSFLNRDSVKNQIGPRGRVVKSADISLPRLTIRSSHRCVRCGFESHTGHM